MSESLHPPARPLEFRSADSWLHRSGAGAKLLAATAVGALALALDEAWQLAALSLVIAAGYAAARLSLVDLWKDLRWLLLQGAVVIALTLALRGGGAFEAGLRTALQLVLVFMPAALVLRTTSTEALVYGSRRWLPERFRLAMGVALRFIPFFARELAELREMQHLRGARIGARDLWRPTAWRDWLACVALPTAVRAIEVAEEAADAAAMRGIDDPWPPRFDEEQRR